MKASTTITALGAALFAASAASAQLVITEIWQGVDGPDHTTDWFELTNFGATDLDITGWVFDDESADPVEGAVFEGLTTIAAGQSVIFVEGGSAEAALFAQVWNLNPNTQVGWHDGPGLGQGGDAVFIFDGAAPSANVIASQAFGSTSGGQSWFWNPTTMSWNDELSIAGQFGAYESNFGPDTTFPAVGSPGLVPTPGTVSIFAIGAMGALRRRRN